MAKWHTNTREGEVITYLTDCKVGVDTAAGGVRFMRGVQIATQYLGKTKD